MLVIFTGTYGVGKTHFMSYLSQRYDFKIIPTYITRALRTNEIEKIHITKDEFRNIMSQNLFAYTKEHFGEFYGIKKRDMEFASSDSKTWMIDFPIDRVVKINEYKYKLIAILPVNATQIIENLTKENRISRISVALEDYKKNYVDLHTKLSGNNILFIRNDFDKFHDNINLINRFLEE